MCWKDWNNKFNAAFSISKRLSSNFYTEVIPGDVEENVEHPKANCF
jgi:hypothetical protein